ncbi:MAG TPA: hypothetical protein VF715_13790 [Thermoleophilaceae bacterium]|jgi:hypothetical protein
MGEELQVELDQCWVRGRVKLEPGKTGAEIAALPGLGIAVELSVAEEDWQLNGSAPAGGPMTLSETGPTEVVVVPAEVDEYRAALKARDLPAALAPLGDRHIRLELTLAHDATKAGFHWIRDASALESVLKGKDWLAQLGRVFADGQPQTIVVGEGAAAYVAAGGIVIRGPNATVAAPTRGLSEAEREFLQARERADPPVPAPPMLRPTAAEGLQGLEETLAGLTTAMTWYWLADKVGERDDGIQVVFTGGRVAKATLKPSGGGDAKDAVELFDFATAVDDPRRPEAVQQAVALAVFTDADLGTAAGPALATAKTILANVGRADVAEALATERNVRDAAISAARAASEAARGAAGKTMERVILQTGAAAGILLANSKAGLDDHLAQRLLAVILALLVLSAVLAFMVEYRGARSALASFKTDLKLYEGTLGTGAIKGIETMATVTTAESTITRSQIATGVILAIAVLVDLLAILALA